MPPLRRSVLAGFVALLAVTGAATGCAGRVSDPLPPPPTTSPAFSCAPEQTSIAWLGEASTPVLTSVVHHHIEQDGVRTTTLLDAPFVPAVSGFAGAEAWLARLGRSYQEHGGTAGVSIVRDRYPWQVELGPHQPGDYLAYSSVERVEARFRISCWPDRGVTGVVALWDDPTTGLLACRLTPPPDSEAALAQQYCPGEAG